MVSLVQVVQVVGTACTTLGGKAEDSWYKWYTLSIESVPCTMYRCGKMCTVNGGNVCLAM